MHPPPFATRTFNKRCIQFLYRAAAQQPQRPLNIVAQNLECAFYARLPSRSQPMRTRSADEHCPRAQAKCMRKSMRRLSIKSVD
jgi:hypothetical protein